MLPLVAIPEVGTLLEGLALSAGGVALYKSLHSEDKIPQLFPFDNSVINVNDMKLPDDTKSTIEPVFDFKDYNYESDVKEEDVTYDANYVKFKMVDNFLSERSDENDDLVPVDLSKAIKNVDVPELQGDNLLETMKSNTQALVTVLSALNNVISSGVVTNSVVFRAFLKGINSLVSEVSSLKKVLVYNAINSTNLVDVLSKKSFEVSAPDVNIENSIDMSSIDNVAEILNTHLSKVAEAKELEKENYEYMKTPKTYTLSDEDLPKLSPRDVIALSEAVKAHLNSQEASLTGEDLEEFENDFDISDVLTKLFNFKGITQDIKEINEKLNEK